MVPTYLKHTGTGHDHTRPRVVKVVQALEVGDVLEHKRVGHRVLPSYSVLVGDTPGAYGLELLVFY